MIIFNEMDQPVLFSEAIRWVVHKTVMFEKTYRNVSIAVLYDGKDIFVTYNNTNVPKRVTQEFRNAVDSSHAIYYHTGKNEIELSVKDGIEYIKKLPNTNSKFTLFPIFEKKKYKSGEKTADLYYCRQRDAIFSSKLIKLGSDMCIASSILDKLFKIEELSDLFFDFYKDIKSLHSKNLEDLHIISEFIEILEQCRVKKDVETNFLDWLILNSGKTVNVKLLKSENAMILQSYRIPFFNLGENVSDIYTIQKFSDNAFCNLLNIYNGFYNSETTLIEII